MTTTPATVKIEKLPLNFKKNGHMYNQVKRTDKVAMYHVTDPETSNVIATEVFLVKVMMNRRFGDKVYPPTEILPGNGEFGKWAWCFGYFGGKGQVLADKRFDEIEAGTYSKDNSHASAEVETEENETDED
jgi:hypothetical protein